MSSICFLGHEPKTRPAVILEQEQQLQQQNRIFIKRPALQAVILDFPFEFSQEKLSEAAFQVNKFLLVFITYL